MNRLRAGVTQDVGMLELSGTAMGARSLYAFVLLEGFDI